MSQKYDETLLYIEIHLYNPTSMQGQFRFADIDLVSLLFLLPAIALLYFYGFHKKQRLLTRFADAELLRRLIPSYSPGRQWMKAILIFFAIFFLVLTLMRPQGDPETKTVRKKGRDLVFVIDVSRSMLAEDLKPNRLARAKQLVSETVDILEGDRVGLLVFAGATAIKSPLTLDYFYFKNALSKIGADDINVGGTHIGDAVRVVVDRLFFDKDNKFRDIVLITDGEDHDSFPIEAAKYAKQKGVKIHTVGLGDPDGSYIPVRKDASYKLLTHKGQNVRTKLDEGTLRKIAQITGGVFVPAKTNLVNLADLYKKYIAVGEKREVAAKQSKIWRELYQFFLGVAIILLMLEFLLGEARSQWRKARE